MKKRTIGLVLVLLVGTLLVGCGKSTDSGSAGTVQSDSLYQSDGTNSQTMQTEKAAPAQNASGVTAPDASQNKEEVKSDSSRKLITTMNISAETEDMDALLNKVNAKVKSLGGYVESSSISNGESNYLDRTNRSASLTIRIPADQLDGLLNDMQNISNIVQQSKNVQDVTLDYVDTESHQKALKAEEKRLMEIMEKASSVEDIIAVEQQLTDVRYQLESIESQLRVYDNQIDYSTVYLDISEVTAYTEPAPENIQDRIITGFKSNLKAVGYGLINLGIWIIIHIPQLLIFAVLFGILLFFFRRFFKKRAGYAGKEKKWKKKNQVLKSENVEETGKDNKESDTQMQQENPEKKE